MLQAAVLVLGQMVLQAGLRLVSRLTEVTDERKLGDRILLTTIAGWSGCRAGCSTACKGMACARTEVFVLLPLLFFEPVTDARLFEALRRERVVAEDDTGDEGSPGVSDRPLST